MYLAESPKRRKSVLGSLFGRKKTTKEDESLEPPTSSGNPFRRQSSINSRATQAAPNPVQARSYADQATASASAPPPPAYSAAPTASNIAQAPSLFTMSNLTIRPFRARSASPTPSAAAADDRFTFLRSFDTIFLIDDSGSMSGTRWTQVSQALSAITPICTLYDGDGIDLKFINAPERPVHSNVTLPSTVHEIFSTVRPSGGTPTGQRLNAILKPYLRRLEANPRAPPKPVNIIVITDGEPSDDVESPIVAAAKKLDRLDAEPWQVGIQFFQVGGDAGARRHLEELDDALAEIGGGCRDIVDTVPFLGGGAELSAEGILKVVLGAVNRRLDRKKGVVV